MKITNDIEYADAVLERYENDTTDERFEELTAAINEYECRKYGVPEVLLRPIKETCPR